MTCADNSRVSFNFDLDVQGDWPPAGSECLPFEPVGGAFRLLVAPLFLKGLSVGDVIECTVDPVSELVFDWCHVSKSDHSTFVLLAVADNPALVDGLERLRALGCSTATERQLGVSSVDVPGAVSIEDVDRILGEMEAGDVMVACPSDRHPE